MRAAPSLPWPIVIISRFLQPTIRVCDRLESLAQEIRARVSRLRHGKPCLQWFGGVLRLFVDSNHQQKSQRYARIQVFPCLAAKNEMRRSETDRCGDGGSDLPARGDRFVQSLQERGTGRKVRCRCECESALGGCVMRQCLSGESVKMRATRLNASQF